MQKVPFNEAIKAIRKKDDRFDSDAYVFLRDSLDYTVKKLRGDESEEHRHVCGPELLEGLRDYALEEYGPLAATVLENWGITRCEDIGDMVFQLIEVGAFGQSDEDDPAHFCGVFDFDDAFREPFRPKLKGQMTGSLADATEEAATPPARGLSPKPSSQTDSSAEQQTLS